MAVIPPDGEINPYAPPKPVELVSRIFTKEDAEAFLEAVTLRS